MITDAWTREELKEFQIRQYVWSKQLFDIQVQCGIKERPKTPKRLTWNKR